MNGNDPSEWSWVPPGTELSSLRFKAGKFTDLSTSADDDM
jgi:hypothetical protein